MPTRIPEPVPRPVQAGPASALPALASAWLAGLVVLAAIAGAWDTRGPCAAPASARGRMEPATLSEPGGPGADVRDMLAHD